MMNVLLRRSIEKEWLWMASHKIFCLLHLFSTDDARGYSFFSLKIYSYSSIWIITYEREQTAASNEDINCESFMRLAVCKYSPLKSTYAHSFLRVVYILYHIFVQFFVVQKISSRHFYSLYITISYQFPIYFLLKQKLCEADCDYRAKIIFG
jgi:hypothetical protein